MHVATGLMRVVVIPQESDSSRNSSRIWIAHRVFFFCFLLGCPVRKKWSTLKVAVAGFFNTDQFDIHIFEDYLSEASLEQFDEEVICSVIFFCSRFVRIISAARLTMGKCAIGKLK